MTIFTLDAALKLFRKLGVNRAVGYGILAKIWSVGAGPVTLILIAKNFSPTIQGYYYTFASLLSLQVFAEFGLGRAIVQFASHEWAGLSFDTNRRIIGDPHSLSRLISLGHFFVKWYTAVSLLTVFGLGIAGYFFFSQSADNVEVNWLSPWIFLCLATGIKIFLMPFWCFIEGCNQVSQVYGYRFAEGILNVFIIWVSILLGGKLWTASIATGACILLTVFMLLSHHRNFMGLVFSKNREAVNHGPTIDWKSEIWPFQWRIGASWIGGYLAFHLFTPILFHYQGAVVAGQMGFTWNAVQALTGISIMWVVIQAPKFGMLIAKKEYEKLDGLFYSTAWISMTAATLGGVAIWLLIYTLNLIHHPFAERFLPPLPSGLFLMGTVLMQASHLQSTYLRAHKKEPFLFLSVVGGILIGLLTWFLASRYGVMSVAAGYLSVVAFFVLPYGTTVWMRCRSQWHATNAAVDF